MKTKRICSSVLVVCWIASLPSSALRTGKLLDNSAAYWKAMGRTAAIAACCSFVAEYSFLNMVVAEYNVLPNQTVKNILLEKLKIRLQKSRDRTSP